jgi:hypothetical protein
MVSSKGVEAEQDDVLDGTAMSRYQFERRKDSTHLHLIAIPILNCPYCSPDDLSNFMENSVYERGREIKLRIYNFFTAPLLVESIGIQHDMDVGDNQVGPGYYDWT